MIENYNKMQNETTQTCPYCLKRRKFVKNKEIINKILNSICFVVLIGVLLFCKTLLFYYSTIAIEDNIETETIVGTICFIITGMCFKHFAK